MVSQQLRKRWKLGDSPIDSVVEMVEDRGGFVVEYPEQGVQFDGLSGRANGRPVVVVNGGSSVDRYRYNIAHELGHLWFLARIARPRKRRAWRTALQQHCSFLRT